MVERSGDQRTWIRIVHVIESATTPLPMTGAGALRLQFFHRQVAAHLSLSFRAESRNLLKLSVLQHFGTQVAPLWVQSANQRVGDDIDPKIVLAPMPQS
jgi:hypothetical protein